MVHTVRVRVRARVIVINRVSQESVHGIVDIYDVPVFPCFTVCIFNLLLGNHVHVLQNFLSLSCLESSSILKRECDFILHLHCRAILSSPSWRMSDSIGFFFASITLVSGALKINRQSIILLTVYQGGRYTYT